MGLVSSSSERAMAWRSQCLNFEKNGSIGFKSGECLARNNSFAPAARMAWCDFPFNLRNRLSMVSMRYAGT